MTRAVHPNQAIDVDLALLIADLSGYTMLTEVHGAHRASEIIHRFERMAQTCRERGVALVERLGDEVLFAGADRR